MHEASLIQNIIEISEQECLNAGYENIDLIRLKVGKASGALPDALLFAFDALKPGTRAKGGLLEIETPEVGGTCNQCLKQFTTPELFVFNCPHCQGTDFIITSGRELDIIDLEVS